LRMLELKKDPSKISVSYYFTMRGMKAGGVGGHCPQELRRCKVAFGLLQ
jgi:hypothetical protein